jgi:diguanylate cyclase (GGDEF)-like protein/PAS domain S-box-containing protein
MRRSAIRPFASRGRSPIAAILLVFGLFSAIGVGLSIRATGHARHSAAVVEVAARQRTLAERYVNGVLLVRAGRHADPYYTARVLARSAKALLDGGTAPPVNGDDDETVLHAARGRVVRGQLEQETRLVHDLTATGSALLQGRPVTGVHLTAHEHIDTKSPILRLRVLAALTSNVSLNGARTIARAHDRTISNLVTLQVILGTAGLLSSLLLGWALMAATRRQTAHFRSLVTSSTDLVGVFGSGGCRYISNSVTEMLGRPEAEVLGTGLMKFVHPDDREALEVASTNGQPHELIFRLQNRFGEWRHVEAHVTDLRDDRHIRGVVLNARDVTERVRLEEELTRQAFHDGLTGLANRALFRDRLDQSLAHSGRSGDPLSVLFVDLDGFKQVNDTLGHDAGDLLLQEVSSRFDTTIRGSDTLARLGGDEFALLLEDADEALAVTVAERLIEQLSKAVRIAGREMAVGGSIGVAIHTGGPGKSEDLMRHADLAMYAAKRGGRGRLAVFHQDMGREMGDLLGLEHEIRLGLQRHEFSVHYQPQISLQSRQIVGVEALLRWTSPSRGAVPPTTFIAVAEASGLIQPLGEFVLREACRQAARWSEQALTPESFVVWVNVSAKQLTAGGFGKLVRSALASAQLPADRLGLEVTETAIVAQGAESNQAIMELQDLHELGVRIAIDDFGTGFSSLSQLRRFPVDLIKVDRSFVRGIEHDAKDEAITTHTVNLAHAIGVLAIAEGVESDAQLTSIGELGCDLAQGYLFAQPTPPEGVTQQLAAQLRAATNGAGPDQPSPIAANSRR